MSEPSQYRFSYQEILEMMVKAAGVREGRWTIIAQMSSASFLGRAPVAEAHTGIVLLSCVERLGIQRVGADYVGDYVVDVAPEPPR